MGVEEKTGLKAYLQVLKTAVSDFLADGALKLAAALSFYAILSLAPLILVVVGVAAYFGGHQAMAQQITEQMISLIGPAGGEIAKSVLESADEPRKGILAVFIGLGTLLFGATGVFVQLQDALNTIWEVERKPGGSFLSFVRSRLLSFAMVLGFGFLLLVSLILSAAITLIQNKVTPATQHGWLWQTVNIGASMVVITALFALMYKLLPDMRIAWRDVITGAVITGLLMTAGKFAIGLYIGHSSVGSAYGAAGSLVVLLVWVYYSAIIVLLGAELTQAYARHRGTALIPKPHARLKER